MAFLLLAFLFLAHLLELLARLIDRADHVEGLLREGIAFAVDDHLEAADRFLQRHMLAGRAGEHLGDVERLRQEALDLARTRHRQLVLGRELVHAHDGDDVAQLLVALQRDLHAAGRRVVFFADHVRVDLARGRIERVDRRIDAQRSDFAGEHDGGVEVAEGGRRARVGQVVRRHVHRLDRRDRAGLGRGDALLQLAHFLGQRRLVTHRRRHAPEQRGHFGAGQREPVDVVDEEQDVLAFVAEGLGHRQTGEADPQAVARRLVHLPEHHRDLVEDVRILHLVIEVVALARALAHAGEHGVAAVVPSRCC